MMTRSDQVDYYQKNKFNPVPIALETRQEVIEHYQKRRNLYERHLGIPFLALCDQSVLELGCNSGETALIHALAGANVTLVEPNLQVLPRLKALFKKFDLEKRIVELVNAFFEEFEAAASYDIVVAEGFLDNLTNRSDMLKKIGSMLRPGGFGVISFNDIFGSLIELTRRLILWQACRLSGNFDFISDPSLEIAKRLYLEDYRQISTSRPFRAWWMDSLVYPLPVTNFWSYQQILETLDAADLELHASSPGWTTVDSFRWYKDVPDSRERHRMMLNQWMALFPYFLTGIRPKACCWADADSRVVASVLEFNNRMIDITAQMDSSDVPLIYPQILDDYLQSHGDPRLSRFNMEMKRLFDVLQGTSLDGLVSAYHGSELVRTLWGTTYHYISIRKKMGYTELL